MRIGGFEIAAGGQPYIVAEIGSNWGSFDDCIMSIGEAAKAGANAVKFQLFNHQTLYGFQRTKASGYSEAHELSIDWIPRLKQKADLCRVDFMCTAFDPESVAVIDHHVSAHKVASSDMNYEELLNRLNRTGKPVFLSTGAATETEIKMAVSQLISVPVVILYCVAAYPAKTVDLTIIDKLKLYSPFVGFSDHTTDAIYYPYAANKFHGACVIEKHFNACKELTPDSPHSLSPTDFRLMVDRIRGKAEGKIGPSPEESDMILRHKRRLIATEDIKRGDLFRRGQNFGPYRSIMLDTKGLNPWNASLLHGKAAARDIQRGEGIGLSDFA